MSACSAGSVFRQVQSPIKALAFRRGWFTLLGLDHKQLTYFFQGRDFRLSDVGGENNLTPRLIA